MLVSLSLEGNGNSLQCSCPGNPMDAGAWWVTVHVIANVRHDLATEQQLRASQVIQWYRNHLFVQKTQIQSLGREDPLEKEMATHSSILA